MSNTRALPLPDRQPEPSRAPDAAAPAGPPGPPVPPVRAVPVVPATEALPCCPPLTERPMTGAEAEAAARMFKALGDPVRLRLFSLVAAHEGGEACVCDILDVGVSQPTVSHHLKKLKEAGLLSSERRGTWVYYRAEPAALAALGRLLGAAEAGRVPPTSRGS